jgi:hypothetical protein
MSSLNSFFITVKLANRATYTGTIGVQTNAGPVLNWCTSISNWSPFQFLTVQSSFV